MEIRILKNTYLFFASSIALLVISALVAGCGAKMVTYEQQLLNEADSLFRAGSYEFAKFRFDKIRTLKPESPTAKIAQYYLGYINVYYENDFGSREAALREFKRFIALYPDDSRVDEVNSWIKILSAMQRFEAGYFGTADSMAMMRVQRQLSEKAIENYVPADSAAMLNDIIRKCNQIRDSLSRKNHELENIILDLEKICQEAGR